MKGSKAMLHRFTFAGNLCLLLVTLLLVIPCVPVPAQEESDGKKQGEKWEALEARKEGIRKLFYATKVEFDKEGKIILTYDFQKREQAIAEDFRPTIESVAKRMRWSRGWEGTYYEWYKSGVVINKIGKWIHKAVWQDVDMEFEYGMLSEIMKKGDIVAAVYAWDKGKHMVGSNRGHQCIYLNSSLKHVKSPLPKTFPPLMKNTQKLTFGLRMKQGVLTATKMGRDVVDTSSKPNYLKKLKPGHVGIAWNGQWVKGIILNIKISGVLDEEWLTKELGETP